MKTKGWVYLLLLASLSWMACDDDDNGDDQSLNQMDEEFTETAAHSNMAEVEFGQIAASKGTDSLVRAFGQQMVTEHTTAQDELRMIADNYDNVDWPESLDEHHQNIRQQLINRSGYSFDSLYMASQVNDHQQAVALFQNETNNGMNQEVKAYASKYLPHIQKHFQKADSIRNVIISKQGS